MNGFREHIRTHLFDVVFEPMEKACEAAAERGQHVGTGAKNRILGIFGECGEEAIERAREEARALLGAQYRQILADVQKSLLSKSPNPVGVAIDALTTREAEKAKAIDGKEKKAALAAARGAIEWLQPILAKGGS